MVGIEIRGLTKSYPRSGGGRKPALDAVELSVAPGEFVSVLGPSGCGKSTLLNILSGVESDFEGTVRFIPERPTASRGALETVISYMFQDCRLLPWLNVRENVRFVLDGSRHDDAPWRRVDDWLERVGLSDVARDYPLELSIGMQQRVAIARALVLEPELLLMDEPFRALDELTAMRMRAELLELWGAHACTVVFVTHDPLEAVYLADRVILMTAGPGRVFHEDQIADAWPRPRTMGDPGLWDASRRLAEKVIAFEPDEGPAGEGNPR